MRRSPSVHPRDRHPLGWPVPEPMYTSFHGLLRDCRPPVRASCPGARSACLPLARCAVRAFPSRLLQNLFSAICRATLGAASWSMTLLLYWTSGFPVRLARAATRPRVGPSAAWRWPSTLTALGSPRRGGGCGQREQRIRGVSRRDLLYGALGDVQGLGVEVVVAPDEHRPTRAVPDVHCQPPIVPSVRVRDIAPAHAVPERGTPDSRVPCSWLRALGGGSRLHPPRLRCRSSTAARISSASQTVQPRFRATAARRRSGPRRRS